MVCESPHEHRGARMTDREHDIQALSAALEEQQRRISQLERMLESTSRQVEDENGGRPSRRNLLKMAGMGVAGAAVGAVALRPAEGHAADLGNWEIGTGSGSSFNTCNTETILNTTSPASSTSGFTALSIVTAQGASSTAGVAGATIAGTASLDLKLSGTGRFSQLPQGSPGAPNDGFEHLVGEMVRDSNGAAYVCLVTGTPGTWAGLRMGGLGVNIYDQAISTQPTLTGSNGTTWAAMGVSVDVTPPVESDAICTGNADLWTNTATYNQDMAIFVSGGSFGSAPGQLVSWKESGGFASFAPNAAFVRGLVPNLAAGTTYTFALYWKTNINAPGVTIYAGAGPHSPFSPTRISVELSPI